MTTAMSTVLVTGASGFVGSHVIPELLAGGHRVIALVHSSAAGHLVLQRLPLDGRGNVELRQGDVNDPASIVPTLAGVDAVVHLVAIARDRTGGRDLLRINTDGTRNVIEAMRTAGVRRLIHLGALAVVDDPTLHYASSKAKAEALVAASGLDWTILKPSLLWGARDGFFNIVADLVRLSPGIVPVPGNGRSRFQPFAVTDLARTVRLSVEDPATTDRAFELGGPRYWTYREITAEVASAMGRRRAIVPMPLPLIRVVAGACEAIGIPFPVATDQLRQLKLDNIGPLDGVQGAFGFVPRDMAGNLGYLGRTKRDQEPSTA
jgi:NADH dehydrogenase